MTTFAFFFPKKKRLHNSRGFFFCHHSTRIRQKKEENLFWFIDKLTSRRRRDIVKIMSCIWVWSASWGSLWHWKDGIICTYGSKRLERIEPVFDIFSYSVQEWILPMTSSLLLYAVMLFTLVITGGIAVGRPACAGIARPAYPGKVAPYDFSSNL
jgi:hypothetical protein